MNISDLITEAKHIVEIEERTEWNFLGVKIKKISDSEWTTTPPMGNRLHHSTRDEAWEWVEIFFS